jgi:uroporphyrin-III C-methyltransferase
MAEARLARVTWRAEGLPMAERRPRLLEALNALYRDRRGDGGVGVGADGPAAQEAPPAPLALSGGAGAGLPTPAASVRSDGDVAGPLAPAPAASIGPGRSGHVTLVGAGPGDPDLLTIRGARRLAEADLVLYDALSSEAMRAHAPGAHWFYVGKRACRQSIGQDVLNRLMIREARRGRRVVRLKCGDPFVFGRGGEEALALAEAGIPCEVVPGVSSAIAGAALAGIPVTHRGAAAAFVVVAGHHPATYRPVLAALPPRGVTVVVMMGLRQRAPIAALLGELGWDASTPAAVVLGAATEAAWRWTGTLATLGAVELPSGGGVGGGPDDRGAPGLLIVGEVVAVAGEIERLRARGPIAAAEAETAEAAAEAEAETESEPSPLGAVPLAREAT